MAGHSVFTVGDTWTSWMQELPLLCPQEARRQTLCHRAVMALCLLGARHPVVYHRVATEPCPGPRRRAGYHRVAMEQRAQVDQHHRKLRRAQCEDHPHLAARHPPLAAACTATLCLHLPSALQSWAHLLDRQLDRQPGQATRAATVHFQSLHRHPKSLLGRLASPWAISVMETTRPRGRCDTVRLSLKISMPPSAVKQGHHEHLHQR